MPYEYYRDCPHYQVHSAWSSVIMGLRGSYSWCSLIDHPCTMEYNGECSEWDEILEEWEEYER